jgi:hypothetical protein
MGGTLISNRFSGFPGLLGTVKTVSGRRPRSGTGLKPGVTENQVLDVLAGVFTQSLQRSGVFRGNAAGGNGFTVSDQPKVS